MPNLVENNFVMNNNFFFFFQHRQVGVDEVKAPCSDLEIVAWYQEIQEYVRQSSRYFDYDKNPFLFFLF